jgi:hypothetical protein
MKYLGMVTCSTLCFLLGTMVPITRSHAQAPPPPEATYYNLSFYKSKPGQDPLAMERELWKPIHEDLRKGGVIQSWSVLSPAYMGPHPYDYMTVIAFRNVQTFQSTKYQTLFEKHWGKDKVEANLKRTGESRDLIGNELWYAAETVGAGSQ